MEEINATPETAPAVEVPPQHPKKKPLKIVVLSVAVLLVVAGAVYGAYAFSKKSVLPVIPPQTESPASPPASPRGEQGGPTLVPTVIPTSNDISDLKTYKNDKYGFEFKYPSNSEVRPIGGPVLLGLNIDTCTISVESSGGLTLPNWLTSQGILPSDNDLSTHIQKSDQFVGGLPAIKITNPVGGGEDTIYVISDKYVYSVNCVFLEKATLSDVEKIKAKYNQILSTFKFLDNSESSNKVSALSIYKEGQLSEWEKSLLTNFTWPKLKSFKTGDKTREVYLVDCEVTNDEIGVKLTGIPVEVSNVPNIAEITLKELVKSHFGGFPKSGEIASFSKVSGKDYVNADSGINGLLLKNDGTLVVNFYDSVAAYGGGSSRVGCLSLSTSLTAKQFSTVKNVKMCINKFENCELDFQP